MPCAVEWRHKANCLYSAVRGRKKKNDHFESFLPFSRPQWAGEMPECAPPKRSVSTAAARYAESKGCSVTDPAGRGV